MPRPKTRDADLAHRMLMDSLAVLEAEGPTALTARRIASESKTSTAALFELFGSKSGLVQEIFLAGFSQLADLIDSLPTTNDPRDDVEVFLESTRRFAVETPMLFDVMFARPFADFDPSEADQEAAGRIYVAVVERVAAWLGTGRRSQSSVDAAHVVVALNRGLIADELAGVLGGSAASVDRRRAHAVGSMLDGIEQRSDR